MNWDRVTIDDDGPARPPAKPKPKHRSKPRRSWGGQKLFDDTRGMTKGDLRRLLGEAAANTARNK